MELPPESQADDADADKKIEQKSTQSRPRSREGGALERASLMKRLGKDKEADFDGGWETGMV